MTGMILSHAVVADCALTVRAQRIAPLGTMSIARPIRQNDAENLAASETPDSGTVNARVLRASGAGRAVARDLLAALGLGRPDIPRAADGVPIWPAGILGSISHDAAFAAAVVTHKGTYSGIGIDVEPAEPLDAVLARLVASPKERTAFAAEPYGDRVLFAIKEAAFKAVYPDDRIFIEFANLTVDKANHTARTSYGRTIHWRAVSTPRVLAIAWC